jgi:hypothetical protein
VTLKSDGGGRIGARGGELQQETNTKQAENIELSDDNGLKPERKKKKRKRKANQTGKMQRARGPSSCDSRELLHSIECKVECGCWSPQPTPCCLATSPGVERLVHTAPAHCFVVWSSPPEIGRGAV